MPPCKNCIVLAMCKSRYVKSLASDLQGNGDTLYVDTIDLKKCVIFKGWWITKGHYKATTSRYAVADLYDVTHLME